MNEVHEAVIEKTLAGKYRLPDSALDLSAWLRDGLEVYNVFVFMKPVFFQMLEALGGEFRASGKKENEAHNNPMRKRVRFKEERVGEDWVIVAHLVDPETDVTNEDYESI